MAGGSPTLPTANLATRRCIKRATPATSLAKTATWCSRVTRRRPESKHDARSRFLETQRHAGAHVLDPHTGAAGIDGRAERSAEGTREAGSARRRRKRRGGRVDVRAHRIARVDDRADVERVVGDVGSQQLRHAVAGPHAQLRYAGKLVGSVSADVARLGKDAAAQASAGAARDRKEDRAGGGGAGAVDRQAAIHVAERALEAPPPPQSPPPP